MLNKYSIKKIFLCSIIFLLLTDLSLLADDTSCETVENLGCLFERLFDQKTTYKDFFEKFLLMCSGGFFIATVLKFKQYKDNPTQIPISTPFVLMLVSILAFSASNLVAPVQKTLFGDTIEGKNCLPGSDGC